MVQSSWRCPCWRKLFFLGSWVLWCSSSSPISGLFVCFTVVSSFNPEVIWLQQQDGAIAFLWGEGEGVWIKKWNVFMAVCYDNLSHFNSGAPRARAEPHSSVNLPIPENLVIPWPYTARLPPVRPHHREPMFNLTFSSCGLGAQENWYCTHIAHQCCDQLTAVKTRYPLTSITWPYRGLRCRPIEVEYLFEVIRWQVTSFQMIAGSSLFF